MGRKLLFALACVAGSVGMFAANASAFDCIRVSTSLRGLQASTKSGNWLLFNLSSPAAVQATAAQFGEDIPLPVATCVANTYASYHLTPYFALGIGVAGGRTGHGPGVVASRAPERVLSDLHGIDHLDDSSVGQALFGSLGRCGIAD